MEISELSCFITFLFISRSSSEKTERDVAGVLGSKFLPLSFHMMLPPDTVLAVVVGLAEG